MILTVIIILCRCVVLFSVNLVHVSQHVHVTLCDVFIKWPHLKKNNHNLYLLVWVSKWKGCKIRKTIRRLSYTYLEAICFLSWTCSMPLKKRTTFLWNIWFNLYCNLFNPYCNRSQHEHEHCLSVIYLNNAILWCFVPYNWSFVTVLFNSTTWLSGALCLATGTLLKCYLPQQGDYLGHTILCPTQWQDSWST